MAIIPRVADLSHWQSSVDFAKVKDAGIWGVIHKASEGVAPKGDAFFDRRKDMVRGLGLLYGAYHFLRPVSIKAQVDNFLTLAVPDPQLLLALDHEDKNVPLSGAKEFIRRVFDKVGRYPVLYSGFLIKQQLGNNHDADLAKVRLWLSHYNAKPKWPANWSAPWLVQYTGDGLGPLPHSVNGLPPNVDLNTYGSTQEQLVAEWAT